MSWSAIKPCTLGFARYEPPLKDILATWTVAANEGDNNERT